MKTAQNNHLFSSEKATNYVETEKKLQVSELRYRRLFEAAQDGILILDAVSGKITDANPFLINLLDYSEKELLGKELWQIGVFKDIVESKAAFLELQNKGYIRYKDLPLLTKKGNTIDVEFVSNTYMVGSEKVIQCNIRDISERKNTMSKLESRTLDLERISKAQEKTKSAMLNVMEDLELAKALLELEKAKDEAVFASIGEGLVVVDNDSNIMIMNRAAEELLGYKSKDMMGKKISNFILQYESGDVIPFEKRPSTRSLKTGESVDMSCFFVRKNKTRFPIAITVTPIRLGKKIIGAIDVFRDITKEREIDRAKTEFVSLASHQLRAPLGISKWYIEAIKKEGYLDSASNTTKDYFNEIHKSNERLLVVVRDLLSISRIDQGKVRNSPVNVSIPTLFDTVLKNMNIVAKKNKINLKLHIKNPTMPSIFIDASRLQELLENLITNAIMYSNPLGIVDITVDCKDDQVLISVKDAGIGISEKDQKNLFTRFFRSEKAKIFNTEGSGLGLYVVKSYVDGWGGTISVKSIEKKGSTFSVSLPRISNSKQIVN